MNFLAYCYEFGDGVKKDFTKAVGYYKVAAIGGNESALRNLSICYRKGIGVKKNDKIADLLEKVEMETNAGNRTNAKILII